MSSRDRINRIVLSLAGALALLLPACGDETSSDDRDASGVAETDGNDGSDTFERTCEDLIEGDLPVDRSPSCSLRDPAGWDPTTTLPNGEARAGKVRDDVRPFSGPEARCGEGDWILQNANIRVCISDKSSNQLFFTGGRIIDIEDPANPGHEFLEFSGPLAGLSELTGDEITLLNDGEGADTAVLRVTGIDMPLKFELGSLGTSILTAARGAGSTIETEYRLEATSRTLEVVTWIKAGEERVELDAGEILFPGDTSQVFSTPGGLGSPPLNAEIGFLAAVDDVSSYGILFDAETNGQAASSSGNAALLGQFIDSLLVVNAKRITLEANEETVFRRWYAVGGPNTTDIEQDFQRVTGSEGPAPAVTRLTFATENPFASEARWVVETTDGVAHGVVSIEDGTGGIDLPDGDYRATPIEWPTRELGEVTFTVPAASNITLPTPAAGYVVANVTDDSEEPLPSKLRFSGDGSFTEYDDGTKVPVAIPAGTWDIEVSFGEEYSFELIETVVVQVDEQTDLNVVLTRQMDTASWVSGDMHQHANRSPDSEIPAMDRVMANLISGVDFMGPSDHDMIEDYTGIVAEMGLAERLHVFQGVEISPVRAHMNAFPMPYQNGETGGGAINLAERSDGNPRAGRQLTQPEMAAAARANGAEIIQINHGRGRSTSSFFDTVGYDPVTGESTRNSEQWFDDFDAMELVNELDNTCLLLRDWFSFHRRGQRVTGLGNSDTHSLGAPSGWPRNYLFVGSDAEKEITDASLVEAIQTGRVSISGNLFLDFTDGTRPGDTVSATAGTYVANLRIQSPTWARAKTLVTYVNGVEVARQTIDSENADIVDFDGAITLELGEDAFVVFIAFSDERLSDVTPGQRPLGITNPVFVDVDGGGFEPPGVDDAEDVPLPTGIPICE